MRVVSLTCAHTEIVTALGCADYLVGVDDHSDRPVDVVEGLTRVGPDLQVDIDKVAALNPDMVLASLTVAGHEKVVAGLEAAKLPYIAPEPCSFDDVYRDIHSIADVLGVAERADALVDSMKAVIQPVQVADTSRPSILVQWWHRPTIPAGTVSWVDGLITLAGGRNVFQEAVKSRPLRDAEVVALNPDIIVISWCGVAFDKYRPDVVQNKADWQDINAIKNQQVHCISEASLGRPGPFLVDGYKALREIIEQYHG